MSIKYRADIDGLRAIAVLVVIFFHAKIPGFSGGFIGVDIFFVISGFLITGIILKEINVGKFSISRFYERRIRRIFPALFPVIAFTLIIGAFLFDYIAFKQLGESIAATTLFASNILFWFQAGYFDSASIQKPLLHTWSLAVEEQFYILFPLLLIAINRYFKSKYLYILLTLGIISLLASIYGVYIYRDATFYLVPTRAWELITGSILALGTMPLLKTNYLRNILSVIGFGLIIYCVVFYTEETYFPGANAVLPVLGAFLIIYSGMGEGSSISRFLSLKLFVFIGLISYSLYLWHWPLIVFAKYLIIRNLTILEISWLIMATFIISWLSQKYIELPFRGNNSIIPDSKMLFSLSAIVMVIMSLAGITIYFQKGMPFRYPDAYATFASQIENDSEWKLFGQNEINVEKLSEGRIPTIIGAKDVTPSFILWGDSHAGMLIPAISKKSNLYGLSGYVMAHSTCLPLLDIDYGCKIGSQSLSEYNKCIIDFIKLHPKIKTVIIAAYWTTNQDATWIRNNNFILRDVRGEYPGNQSYSALLRVGLFRTVKTLSDMGCKVVLISGIPVFDVDPVKIIWQSNAYGTVPDYDKILPSISEYSNRNKAVLEVLNELSTFSNVTLIHPENLLFDKSGRVMMLANNKMLYRDNIHLSKAGSEIVAPVFDDVFKKITSE